MMNAILATHVKNAAKKPQGGSSGVTLGEPAGGLVSVPETGWEKIGCPESTVSGGVLLKRFAN